MEHPASDTSEPQALDKRSASKKSVSINMNILESAASVEKESKISDSSPI